MASGAQPLTYNWSWGDGTYDNTPFPSHTYSTAGYYNICLTISDANGCSSSYCDSTNINKSGNTVISVDVIHQGTSGIKEIPNNDIMKFYPNPATSNITIITSGKANISILNIEGQVKKNITTNTNKTNIDISSLSSGIYFIKVQSENGIVTKKFIKQ